MTRRVQRWPHGQGGRRGGFRGKAGGRDRQESLPHQKSALRVPWQPGKPEPCALPAVFSGSGIPDGLEGRGLLLEASPCDFCPGSWDRKGKSRVDFGEAATRAGQRYLTGVQPQRGALMSTAVYKPSVLSQEPAVTSAV